MIFRPAVFLAALAIGELHRAQAALSRGADVVEIGVEDAAAPWSQPDGTGYVNDIVKAAFAASGVSVRLRVLPYTRCKQLTVAGRLPVCVSMSPAPELERSVVFSQAPLFVFRCTFFGTPARPLPKTLDALPPGTVVGMVLGYEYPPELLAMLARRKAVIESATSEEINLRKLARGRIGAAIVNRDEIKSESWVVTRAGVQGRVTPAFTVDGLPAYAGFSVAHPRGRELARLFDRGYARITANGVRAKIKKRWTTGTS